MSLSVLSDIDLVRMINNNELVVDPFVEDQVSEGCISYGLSSCGIDLRVAPRWKIFTDSRCAVVDPKNFNKEAFVDYDGMTCLIPPNSFVLASAVEYIALPPDLVGFISTKSTYARCGIACPFTIAEPGWRGRLTLEIANNTPLPAKVYANEGVVQIVFFRLSSPCRKCYAKKEGRYQDQKDITLPFVQGEKKDGQAVLQGRPQKGGGLRVGPGHSGAL